ncbi:helix-turn-helix domain-containing protein [Polymorphospora sp. NPDC050346]|uniref:TetR/AcrR family transcriptional regulator n=1 Tax=Polymorphospora sp. NPDC050346 TaxID=3155780 RepID=UPI0033E5D79D
MAHVHRQQVDEGILDRAAALFAQHGYDHTSLKTVADSVGLSKAGLLHHYPTKEALYLATQQSVRAQGQRVFDQVADLPPGPARDRRALELLTDVALDRPGLVAQAFSSLTTPPSDGEPDHLDDIATLVFATFAVDAAQPSERLVRVIGALSALAVLSLSVNRAAGEKTMWRPHILATCLDALGHHRRTLSSDPTQVEA